MASDSTTLEATLREGARRLENVKTPLLDARVLLKTATGHDDAALISHSHEMITPLQSKTYFDFIARRVRGEPVAYITGAKEFWSLPFRVTPDVLIPREDSECLIEAVLSRRSKTGEYSILDLGAGSGCLLCALLSELPESRGIGVDRSEKALAVARENAAALGLSDRTEFLAGDWAAGLEGVFDIIIANPPYIAESQRRDLPAEVSAYEPAEALFGGADGFGAYRAILADAPRLLAQDGLIVFEAGDGQANRLCRLAAAAFPDVLPATVNDLKGIRRGVLADRKTFTKKD